MFKTVIRVLK